MCTFNSATIERHGCQDCIVHIGLAEDFETEDGKFKQDHSRSVYQKSLLSVSALVDKFISVFFVPGKDYSSTCRKITVVE